MNSKTGKFILNQSLALAPLRVAALVCVLFAVVQTGNAQGRVEEDEVRRKTEEKNDIAQRQEAAERARVEAASKTDKLNETKPLNEMEPLNKEKALNKPEIRGQAKLKEASETLKEAGMKEATGGGTKATEAGNPKPSDGTQTKGRSAGRTK